MNRLLLVVMFPFAATGLGAQIIPVSGGGAALANAVASAPDGAVLVVAPGTYDPFSAAQRHLTLVAPQRATIRFFLGTTAPALLTVIGISAAQPFRMVGFDVLQAYAPGYPYPSYGVISCRDAHLEECTCQGILTWGGVLLVARCTVTAVAGSAVGSASGSQGSVVLVDSTFWGGYVTTPLGIPQGSAPGIGLSAFKLRAERIQVQTVTFASQSGPAVALSDYSGVPCTATIADSVLIPGWPTVAGASIACTPATTLTVSGTQTPGGITCAYATTPLATLRWLVRQWTPGGTSALRSQHLPATLAIAVVSLSAVPFTSPLIAEQSFVGANPDWFVHAFGVSNALGEFDWNLTLPPSPSLQYAEAWLHGVSMPGPPLHVSTPLGGLIR
ncbi:MAG: hypothetical protein WAT39_02090 [Planctomycetota bacterium]